MTRGRPTQLQPEEIQEIRSLTFRQAQLKYAIGYATWKKIKEHDGFQPLNSRRPREQAEVVEAIVKSVEKLPHLNTQERAKLLKLSTKRVQEILTGLGLSKLDARLRRAGYQVEVVRPLQIARLRRVVAAYPGSLTHIDYKTFGFLRGQSEQKKGWLGGFVVIDSLTGFADVTLSSRHTGEAAVKALENYRKKAPFKLEGIVFSDNGEAFLSDLFMTFVYRLGLLQRTTRYHHPWSNGKVEALNKTLKFQCFPALAHQSFERLEDVQLLVDRWMQFYNEQRAHTGFVNRGLPPLAFYRLWENTPGNYFEKLIKLGVIDLDNEWSLRMMGSGPGNAGERPGDAKQWGSSGNPELPFAFVLERERKPAFIPSNGDAAHLTIVPRGNLVLAK